MESRFSKARLAALRAAGETLLPAVMLQDNRIGNYCPSARLDWMEGLQVPQPVAAPPADAVPAASVWLHAAGPHRDARCGSVSTSPPHVTGASPPLGVDTAVWEPSTLGAADASTVAVGGGVRARYVRVRALVSTYARSGHDVDETGQATGDTTAPVLAACQVEVTVTPIGVRAFVDPTGDVESAAATAVDTLQAARSTLAAARATVADTLCRFLTGASANAGTNDGGGLALGLGASPGAGTGGAGVGVGAGALAGLPPRGDAGASVLHQLLSSVGSTKGAAGGVPAWLKPAAALAKAPPAVQGLARALAAAIANVQTQAAPDYAAAREAVVRLCQPPYAAALGNSPALRRLLEGLGHSPPPAASERDPDALPTAALRALRRSGLRSRTALVACVLTELLAKAGGKGASGARLPVGTSAALFRCFVTHGGVSPRHAVSVVRGVVQPQLTRRGASALTAGLLDDLVSTAATAAAATATAAASGAGGSDSPAVAAVVHTSRQRVAFRLLRSVARAEFAASARAMRRAADAGASKHGDGDADAATPPRPASPVVTALLQRLSVAHGKVTPTAWALLLLLDVCKAAKAAGTTQYIVPSATAPVASAAAPSTTAPPLVKSVSDGGLPVGGDPIAGAVGGEVFPAAGAGGATAAAAAGQRHPVAVVFQVMCAMLAVDGRRSVAVLACNVAAALCAATPSASLQRVLVATESLAAFVRQVASSGDPFVSDAAHALVSQLCSVPSRHALHRAVRQALWACLGSAAAGGAGQGALGGSGSSPAAVATPAQYATTVLSLLHVAYAAGGLDVPTNTSTSTPAPPAVPLRRLVSAPDGSLPEAVVPDAKPSPSAAASARSTMSVEGAAAVLRAVLFAGSATTPTGTQRGGDWQGPPITSPAAARAWVLGLRLLHVYATPGVVLAAASACGGTADAAASDSATAVHVVQAAIR